MKNKLQNLVQAKLRKESIVAHQTSVNQIIDHIVEKADLAKLVEDLPPPVLLQLARRQPKNTAQKEVKS